MKFVPTSIGLFRQAARGDEFQFLCPVCGEWLPMGEERLGAREPVDHPGCDYAGAREYGKWLVSTLQARRLMANDGEPILTYGEHEPTARAEAISMHNPALDAPSEVDMRGAGPGAVVCGGEPPDFDALASPSGVERQGGGR